LPDGFSALHCNASDRCYVPHCLLVRSGAVLKFDQLYDSSFF